MQEIKFETPHKSQMNHICISYNVVEARRSVGYKRDLWSDYSTLGRKK